MGFGLTTEKENEFLPGLFKSEILWSPTGYNLVLIKMSAIFSLLSFITAKKCAVEITFLSVCCPSLSTFEPIDFYEIL
jgi:hypothetical protein